MLPADGVIQVSFDRYLLPSTTIRQAVVLTDANNKPVTGDDAPIVTYDPIARTVTLSSPKPPGTPWLQEGQPYKVFLLVPPDDDTDEQGLRAIDRSPLWSGQPLEIAFYVGPKTGVGSGEPTVSFCTDVLPIFIPNCGSPVCHGSSTEPAAGLVLDTATGVSHTALGRVAHGANTSGRAGDPEAPGRDFGVNMAIIQPGNPGASWLMYKVDLAPPPDVDAGSLPSIACNPPAGSPAKTAPAPDYFPLAPAVLSANDLERSILGNYVLGREMPFPISTPLSFQQREKIRLWIAQGAHVTECGSCGSF